MKIIYVAPRYHTNQIPVMKGFFDKGIKVKFLATNVGVSEVHDYVEFELIKKSKISNRFPSFSFIYHSIKSFSPDIVIMRDHSFLSFIVNFICILIGIKGRILYTQDPLCGTKSIKAKVRSFFSFLFPKVVFSPVCYWGESRFPECYGKNKINGIWYLPLITENPSAMIKNDKIYCEGGILRILDVGKYRPYKNHYILVDAINEMKQRDNVHLVIIGEVQNDSEKAYFSDLYKYIQYNNLEGVISLRKNIPFEQMGNLYENFDVLVLPSIREAASVAILEAMSNGLCVISSCNNGTSCYLDMTESGIIFNPSSSSELSKILDELVIDNEIVRKFGEKAKRTIVKDYSFQNYFHGLSFIVNQEFGIKL